LLKIYMPDHMRRRYGQTMAMAGEELGVAQN